MKGYDGVPRPTAHRRVPKSTYTSKKTLSLPNRQRISRIRHRNVSDVESPQALIRPQIEWVRGQRWPASRCRGVERAPVVENLGERVHSAPRQTPTEPPIYIHLQAEVAAGSFPK